jgi:mannitol/fructose-specific phosphotransferase system IIA component (Ntr-type)
MKLSAFLDKKLIFLDRSFSDYSHIIDFVSDTLGQNTSVSAQDIKAAFVRRENIGTTFLGRGLALPHGYVDGYDGIRICYVRLTTAMRADASEKSATIKHVFAVLTSKKRAAVYLKILAAIARLVTDNVHILEHASNIDGLLENLHRMEEDEVGEVLLAREMVSNTSLVFTDETVGDVVDRMKQFQVTFLPVIDRNHVLKGIIDITDLFAAMFPGDAASTENLSLLRDMKDAGDLIFEPLRMFLENEDKRLAGGIMKTCEESTIAETASYADVIMLMTKHHLRHIVVVKPNREVLGVIDTGDVIDKMIRA